MPHRQPVPEAGAELSAPASGVLQHLDALCLDVQRGWVPPRWQVVSGAGQAHVATEPFFLPPYVSFRDLPLRRGGELQLQLALDVPEVVHGVRVQGDALELRLLSAYPIELHCDGRPLLVGDTVPTVATGPALITVLPAIEPGRPATLTATWRIGDVEPTRVLNLFTFTTARLRRRFHLLDVARARLRLAAALADSRVHEAAVEAAASRLSGDLLALDDDALQATVDAVAHDLAWCDGRAAELRVHLVGHAHVDLAWLWRWEDAREVIRRDVRTVLTLMEEFPELTYVMSQAAAYDVVREDMPECLARIREHVRAGRWEVASMQWVEGDVNLASGESQVRQLCEGVHFTRTHLGVSPTVLLAPDTFGHAGNLPQLVAGAGGSAYFHMRGNPAEAAGSRWLAYRWEGDDGSALTAASQVYGGEITAGDVVRAALLGRDQGMSCALLVHGVCDHGGGPARQALETARRLAVTPGLPSLVHGNIGEFVQEAAATGLPLHHGESSTVFEGCYTTHADVKAANRQGERLLGTASTLAAMAALDRRSELDAAWRRVLFAQFHDILGGTAIDDVYRDCAREFEEVGATGEAVVAAALDVLEAGLDEGLVAVTNQLGWARRDAVEAPLNPRLDGPLAAIAADGTVVPAQRTAEGVVFVARVPALSTVGYRLAPYDHTAPSIRVEMLDAERYARIETASYSAVLELASGVIVSHVDRGSGRSLLRRRHDDTDVPLGFNRLHLVDEEPHEESAWLIGDVRHEEALGDGATTRLVECGPVRAVFSVERRFRSSHLRQRISFYAELPRIDVETWLDWQEPGGPAIGVPQLKVGFAADLDGAPQAWYETPFAAAHRPADGREVPALRWADLSSTAGGFAVLNDGKHGHDALGGCVRLTLLRTAYEPDPCSDRGLQRFRYAVLPHQGDWRDAEVPRRAAEFDCRLRVRIASGARASTPAPARLPSLECSPGVLVTAVEKARDGAGTVVRFVESHGRSGRACVRDLQGRRVTRTNLLQDRLHDLPPDGDAVALDLRPFEVATLVVEPAARAGS